MQSTDQRSGNTTGYRLDSRIQTREAIYRMAVDLPKSLGSFGATADDCREVTFGLWVSKRVSWTSTEAQSYEE